MTEYHESTHPSLNFECPVTKEHVSLGFGYLAGEPMMPVFKGDELVTMISREILIIALQEGWGGTESGWWVDPSNN